ncbi:hypothetical protein AV654_29660 [Paenibacillus elgii]|uniref:HTH araC/xylS-type domain-containing protein n=1 Tax=Paenibacillus elgii TaxID=189691 RepID=A0A163V7E4_9BACL|nr:helix-turn-helix domain-containing protein [Paenibacillus elgii]KZE74457.1 hypothetical protein AV654_29660 [Paenibacillus elgii]
MISLLVRQSLFRKILTSFMILIVIFALVDVAIFSLVKNRLHGERIEQNRLTLRNAADRYHSQFERVKNALYKQYTDKDVTRLNRLIISMTQKNSFKTDAIVDDIQVIVREPELYLHNMMLLFKPVPLLVDKKGATEEERLFSDIFTSETYSLSYWKAQFEREPNYVIHPAASFFNPAEHPEEKTLIPYSIKPPTASYLIVAMIDAERLRQAIAGEHSPLNLTILRPDGRVLYRTDTGGPELPDGLLTALPAAGGGSDYTVLDGNYYFSQQDADGLQYILTVPGLSFAEEANRLNKLMLLVMAAAVIVSLVLSVLFSKRIHKPVRELLSSISNPGETALDSQIHEFDLIGHKIQTLLKEKDEILGELRQQQSVLNGYDYIAKLKNINHELSDWHSIPHDAETFTIVLYELRFRSAAFVDMPINRELAAQSIGEHLKLVTDERFPGSYTFRMEAHQFLSVVPGNERDRLVAMLEELKPMLDRDRRHCLVTAAVSSWFGHSAQLGHAYKQVQEMARQARLLEEMQIVLECRNDPSVYALTLTQEQELNAALQAANAAEAVRLVDQWLDELDRDEASVRRFRLFASSVSAQAQKIVEHYKVEASTSWRLKPMIQQLGECCTVEEYRGTLQAFLNAVTVFIKEKKEASDPIVEHVLSVLQGHYAEDLSLEALAGTLNLTPAYVSTYIKEKTGVNFTDHLHDIRVRKAQELLLETGMNIQEIAEQVGYRNISSFNRMFKNRTGQSPGEYRRTQTVARTS